MEDALRALCVGYCIAEVLDVLILVLMEDALREACVLFLGNCTQES